jgi:hypothetical protein
VFLVSAVVSSTALAGALNPNGAQQLQLGKLRAALQPKDAPFSWTRHPGRARFDALKLSQPSVQYDVPLEGAVTQVPNGFLVGRRGVSSFHTVSSAFNEFFFNDSADPGNINFTLGRLISA